MGFPYSSLCFIYVTTVLLQLSIPISETASPNMLDLVYKGCSNQTMENDSFHQNLNTLFTSLMTRASSTKFFDTSLGSGENTIAGLFQCRGDLGSSDCSNCVQNLCEQSNHLCGSTMAARIQFHGCYMHYETVDFPITPDTGILYSNCNPIRETESGFHKKKETAFGDLQSGLLGGSGFDSLSYQGVHVLAQCLGDVVVGDCGECVRIAIETVETECGDSIAGQVYLEKCYLIYEYFPDGNHNQNHKKKSIGSSETGRTVAIVVGGAAAVFLGYAFLSFMRSFWRNKEDY